MTLPRRNSTISSSTLSLRIFNRNPRKAKGRADLGRGREMGGRF